MPLRSFANFKLIMIRHRKELRGAPNTWGPRPWPTWPMRKSVTAYKEAHSVGAKCRFSLPTLCPSVAVSLLITDCPVQVYYRFIWLSY